ncbi:hypothetical protein QJS10_CPB22g00317 [Acorus calamus]|uniref:Uncharacterized protein n=1 Tax=Acorus calamus TaxID=4465 RepID=A0AAV9BZZ0_ACOCL|nr:hypothetical protein QJS10_CPB22g00317 [Acorus calamus]
MVDDELLTKEGLIAEQVVNHIQAHLMKEQTWRNHWADQELPKLSEMMCQQLTAPFSLENSQCLRKSALLAHRAECILIRAYYEEREG